MEAGEPFETEFQFCSANNEAEDQLAALAEMVGRGETLGSPTDVPLAAGDVPPLEYDLEAELARALDGAMPQPAATAPHTNEPVVEVPTVPTEESSPPSMEFSAMISEELDRAIQENPAADNPAAQPDHSLPPIPQFVAPTEQPPAEAAAAPDEQANNVFADELARMLAMPDEKSTPAPAEPAVAETASPEPEIALAMPELGSASEPVATVEKDYSDPAAEFQSFFGEELTADDSNDPAVEVAPVDPAPAEAVLGASAALGAAALLGLSKLQQPEPEISLDRPHAETVPENVATLELDDALSAELDEAFLASPEMDDDVRIPEAHVVESAQRKGSGRKAAVVVLAIALLGGVGALAFNMFGNGGEAPVLLAEEGATKVKPKDSGGQVVPNQDQTVYKTVEGNDSTASEQASLRDNTEQPVRVAKSETRITSSDDSNVDLLKPRAVRTVVVKPDGTIVSSTEPAQVEKLNVANLVPVAATEPKPVKTIAIKPAAQKPLYTAPTDENAGQVETEVKSVKVASVEPTQSVEVEEPKPVKTTVVKKPVAKKVEVAKTPDPKPATEPKPTQTDPIAAESLPSVSSPYAVQVSSRRSPASAKDAWSKISRRYASVLGGYNVDIRKIDIKGKGTYYRVRVPASSKANAQKLCSRLKSAGGDCLVTR